MAPPPPREERRPWSLAGLAIAVVVIAAAVAPTLVVTRTNWLRPGSPIAGGNIGAVSSRSIPVGQPVPPSSVAASGAGSEEVFPGPGDPLSSPELQVLSEVNDRWVAAGCARLSQDPGLIAAARDHAHEMVTLKYLNRISPRGETVEQRATRFGHRGAVVEAFLPGDSARSALDHWNGDILGGGPNLISTCRWHSIGVGYDPGTTITSLPAGIWVVLVS